MCLSTDSVMTGQAPIVLREYQERIVAELRALLPSHRSVLVQSATGSGKTCFSAVMAAGVAAKGRRAIFAVHRRELLAQTSNTFARVGVPHGLIQAGQPIDTSQRVQVAMLETLRRRNVPAPDLLVVDEAAHAASTTWAGLIERYRNDGAYVVGLTATPARLDGRGLGQWFSAMVQGPPIRWLISQGYLSDYRIFAPPPPDTRKLRIERGDYARDDAAALMTRPYVLGSAVSHYQRHAPNRLALIYCVSRDASRRTAEAFCAAGISAVHLDGETPDAERRETLQKLARREIQVVCNVELFVEGTDLAALAGSDVTIEAVSILRPTQSLGMHLQMCGRALRPKNVPAIILDHAGNTRRHGRPDDPHAWSLDGLEKPKRRLELAPDIRECPACWLVYEAAKKACPECGEPAPTRPREVVEIDGDLVDLTAADEAKQEKDSARQFWVLQALARKRGYRDPAGWARHVMEGRRG